MHELRKQSPLDEKSKEVTHPDTRMLSITVAPTAIPANSPTCSKQKRETQCKHILILIKWN